MTLTADELARLRVPLSALPGFIAIGLHCRDISGEGGLVCGISIDGELRFCGCDSEDWRPGFADLADPSTADRVARWVAGRVGLEVGCTAPSWASAWDRLSHWVLTTYSRGNGAPGPSCTFFPEEGLPFVDLDPTDDRRLPRQQPLRRSPRARAGRSARRRPAMKIHPSYFAAFTPDRGGAIHEQYCVTHYTFDLYREGRILHTSEPVFSLVGSWFWYRLGDFVALMSCAADPAYRSLADVQALP